VEVFALEGSSDAFGIFAAGGADLLALELQVRFLPAIAKLILPPAEKGLHFASERSGDDDESVVL
jgi:hypothetical protein